MTEYAFPTMPIQYSRGDQTYPVTDGMTLRDYFAAKAMQGLCAGFSAQDRNWPRSDELETYEVAAEHSYLMADAMLEARK